MNILTLNYEYPPIGGGAATFSKDIAEAFAKRGHKITIVTMGYKELPEHEMSNGVEIYRIPCLRSKAAVCYPWEQLTYIISAKRFLRRFLKNNSFDICHAHFIIPTGVVARWIKKHYKLPYAISSHGSDVPGYNQKRFKILHKLLIVPWKKICEEADSIIPNSAFLSNLIEQSIPQIHSNVIPYGFDVAVYQNSPKENSILALSRLQEHKGIQRLIRAFAQIPHSGWTVHIAGDGPYRDDLEMLVKQLDLTDSVVFHGWLENKSKGHIELLAKAKIFVSASDFESYGISTAEAILSDCRVILSDIPVHKNFEIFGAHFFSAEDIKSLSKLLQKSMALPPASSPFKEQLSMEHTVVEYEKLLKTEVIGGTANGL